MEQKTVFFRIGSDKAGTVTIENLLMLNAGIFCEDGIFCPFRNAIGFVNYFIKAHRLTDIDMFSPVAFHLSNPASHITLNQMLRTRQWEQFPKIVLTTETIWGRLTKTNIEDTEKQSQIIHLFNKIRAYFPGYSFKIILHLRRADRYFESLWSQHVKSGGKLEFEAFIARLRKKDIPRNSEILMGLLENVFGQENIILKPFEREQMHSGDLIEDFLHTIGSDRTSDDLALGSSNESLHSALLNVLHETNNSHGKMISNQDLIALTDFLKENLDLPDSRLMLCPEQRREILNEFSDFYDYLSARYKSGRPLFMEAIPQATPKQAKIEEQDKQMLRAFLFSIANEGYSTTKLKKILSGFQHADLNTHQYCDISSDNQMM